MTDGRAGGSDPEALPDSPGTRRDGVAAVVLGLVVNELRVERQNG